MSEQTTATTNLDRPCSEEEEEEKVKRNIVARTVPAMNQRISIWSVKGVAAALGMAFLLLSVACGAAEPERPPSVPAAEPAAAPRAVRESAPAAPAMESAPAQLSRPASAPPQPQSIAPAPQSQSSSSSAPSSSASQGAQTNQSGPANTAPRTAPRNIPRDTATTGPQPLVSANLDPISTFSLDTDQASFQRALQETQDGYQIDPADVRAEEWINSLNYDYPRPSRPDEFAVHTEVFHHPDTQGMHLARVGIQAPDAQKRRPVNVTLVLDTSGSMADGNRLQIAERAAQTILTTCGTATESRGKVEEPVNYVVPHTSPRNARRERDLTELWAGGSTNVQAGLDEALWLADGARRDNPEAVNYVILFSDGVANVNATDPFGIVHL